MTNPLHGIYPIEDIVSRSKKISDKEAAEALVRSAGITKGADGFVKALTDSADESDRVMDKMWERGTRASDASADEILALRAEIKRLREALEQLRQAGDDAVVGSRVCGLNGKYVADVCDKALAEPKP